MTTIRGKVKSFVPEEPLLVTTKGSRSGKFRIAGYASKPVVDRVGDIVDVESFLGTMPKFMQNPIMLYMHDAREPVGVWTDYELRQDGLWLEGEILQGTPTADKARLLIEHGALRALSIGFREIDAGPEDDEHYHIRKLDLLEVSLVSIPALAEALFEMDESGKLLDIKMLDDDEKQEDPIAALALTVKAIEEKYTAGDTTLVGVVEREKVTHAVLADLASRYAQLEHQVAQVEKSLIKIVKWEALRLAQEMARPEKPQSTLGN